RLPATGVDDREPAPGPFGVIGDPVPGHPGRVLDHCLAAAEEPVDQGRLADIRPPDHRHHRQLLASLRGDLAVGAEKLLFRLEVLVEGLWIVGIERLDVVGVELDVGVSRSVEVRRSHASTPAGNIPTSTATTPGMSSPVVFTSTAPSAWRSGEAARLLSR